MPIQITALQGVTLGVPAQITPEQRDLDRGNADNGDIRGTVARRCH